jgi:hypothetical protein
MSRWSFTMGATPPNPRAKLIALFSVALTCVAWAACNKSTSAAGTGGADCSGGPFVFECDQCIESVKECCTLAAACYADLTCLGCASAVPVDAGTCTKGATPAWDQLLACINAQCDAPCVPHSSCNPVTNDGCADAGQACDLDQDGVYVCFPTPVAAPLCAGCSNENGPFCAGTLHCLEQGGTASCARYCCDDGDCGGGMCDTSSVPGGVGLCVAMLDAGANPACPVNGSGGPPTSAPSNGACLGAPKVDGG